jgi:hypothetical protein
VPAFGVGGKTPAVIMSGIFACNRSVSAAYDEMTRQLSVASEVKQWQDVSAGKTQGL